MPDVQLYLSLEDIKRRLADLEGHKDDRIKSLEDLTDQLTQRVEALEKRKK